MGIPLGDGAAISSNPRHSSSHQDSPRAGGTSQAQHNLPGLLGQGLISAAETGGFLPTSQNPASHIHPQEEKWTEEGQLSRLLDIPCGDAKKKKKKANK